MSRKVPIVCHGHSRPIVEVHYSNVTPDGYFLASASKDTTPMLRHGETGDWYGTFQGHKGAVWSCVLNQPALLCATGSADFTARIWDACSGNQLHEFSHSHIVRSTAFSHQTNKLATGGMEKVVRIYDLSKPEEVPDSLALQPSGIRCLQWLQDDTTLLYSFTDKPGICIADIRTKQVVKTIDTDAPVTSLEATFDGQYITTAEARCVKIYDAKLNLVAEHKMKHNTESASYAPSKKRFVAGGEDMWVHVYDSETGAEVEYNKGHHGPVHTVRFSPTYDSYASGSEDGTIRIWYLDSATDAQANGNEAQPAA